ncbi:WD repeat-containing protein jip5 [Zymoseptoria brevis]|uniref:WD repeat-containing protein JIP5 n=1 Tax=Zymoseptoria brevis TaxID=1047168 RepID=A0A0F4GRP1_9PEZI|nr:WD repeat-containing protein jip5 [Zymoseptoria brevis]
MFDTLCTLPLSHELFAQAVHPTAPIVAVGLSSGHVATLQLPPVDSDSVEPSTTSSSGRRGSSGTDIVDTAWRTRRHKGSCRCLAYSLDGRQLYSAGTDGLVKAADAETGKVTGKLAIPSDTSTTRIDAPTVIHALSPQTFLLTTDSGALHIYDLRDPAPSLPLHTSKTAFLSSKPSQTFHPHTDYISSLSPIPPSSASTSGFSKQWLTTGSTTLALTDLRRGVLAKSEDQEEILLSSLYITGLQTKKSSGSSGEKAIVGGGDGVITLWEKGQWDDQDERIVVSREKETLDCLAHVPDGIGGLGRKVAVGLGDGKVRVVRLGQNRVVAEVVHDEVEGVGELGFDVGGRMISGGGMTVKVWTEHMAGADWQEADEEEEEEGVASKRAASGDSEDDADEQDEAESSDEEEKPKKKKRKRGKGKGPAAAGSGFDFSGL